MGEGCARRVGVFDDSGGGFLEVADELPCGVGVNVVVVGHFFAVQDFGAGDACEGSLSRVKRRVLVRVFAVAEVGGFMKFEVQDLR